jgi:hypothetical protein
MQKYGVVELQLHVFFIPALVVRVVAFGYDRLNTEEIAIHTY